QETDLEIAALAAGTPLNVLALSRDTGVARDTVRAYLSVLEDTLIGSWLPAYRPRAKVKEVSSPKFYWFDSGVLNAAIGSSRNPPPPEWDWVLLEHLIFHEFQTYMECEKVKGNLGYWGTPGKNEIDFVHWYSETVSA